MNWRSCGRIIGWLMLAVWLVAAAEQVPVQAQPADSRIEYRQASAWDTYRWQIIAAGVLVAVQAATIGLLLTTGRRRRRAEEAAGAVRYRGLFAHMHNAFNVRKVIVDEAGRPADLVYVEVNPGFERLYGLRAADVIGRRVTEVFPGMEKEEFDWIKVLGEVALTGKPVNFEGYFATAGKWMRFDVYCPEKGYVATVMQDITENKQAEEKQRELYRQLEKSMRQTQEMNATLEEEIAERQAAQETLVELNATLEEEIAERQAAQEALSDLNANLEAIVAERTEWLRRQAELLDSARDFIMVRDLDSRVTYWNRGAEKGYGFTAAEAVGRITHELLKTEFPESAEKTTAGLFAEGYWEGELVHTRKDGTRLTVASHWTLLRDEGGQPAAIMEINHDVTAEKKAAAMIREANLRLRRFNAELEATVAERTAELQRVANELAETNKELISFTNSIAHDFRSPMVNLKGFSHELGASLTEADRLLGEAVAALPAAERAKVNELLARDVPEALGFIYKSVDSLDKMVNAMLGLARLGRRELATEEVDMAEVTAKIFEAHKHDIDRQDIGVTVGRLPRIISNRLAMEQIAGNLIDNAIKYLRPGVPGRIAVTASENGGEYVFAVADNGRGIAEEDRDKVFQVFRRAGEQDVPGEGLGLAYVRTLIRQLGGKVWYESVLGEGTTMYFSVPKQGTGAM